jgi:methionyl-tRNA formyltransferase
MARIAFFGTPEFSLAALQQVDRFCRARGHQLVMVVSQPDKEQGRGQKLSPPPVKILATSLERTVFQPVSLRKNTPEGDEFYQTFSEYSIDLAIVVAYGKIIPQRFLSAASVGFVNIHGSLLPRFRGAAPIQRAIEAGDLETGVCLMDMVLKLDEGDVFDQVRTPIIASDTSATLFRRLSRLGADLLYRRLDDLLEGRIKKVPQNESDVCYAHMLTKEEAKLSFSRSGRELARQVRAFDPWPHSYGYINKKRVKFFDSFFIASTVHKERNPGTIVVTKPFLGVKTIDGILYFQRMQVEGKTVLPIIEASRGFSINVGDKICESLE